MPTLVTDPEIIRRVKEAAGKGQAAPTAAPTGGRVVTDPNVIQAVKNRKRFNDAAAKKRQQILETGQTMPEAPDRIAQAFEVAAQGPAPVGPWVAGLQGAGDSAALGFGDEIGAALDLPVSTLWSGNADDAYNINLARRRQALEQAQEQQPVATLAGELGGALLAPGLGVGTAVKGATLGTRLLRGMGTGATQGAVYGVGSGEGAQDRAVGGLVGAGVGTIAGAAAPLLTSGAIGAVKGAKYLNPLRGTISREGQAAQQVGRALSKDAGGAQKVPAQLRKMQDLQRRGIPAVVGDAGGEATGAIARAAANISPEAKGALENVTGSRFRTQNDRATAFIRSIVGNTDLPARQEQLQTAARQFNRPAWARAYREGDKGLWSPELQRLATSPAVISAMQSAATRGQNRAVSEGFGGFRSGVTIDPSGIIKFAKGKGGVPSYPNLQYWDVVRRGLSDAADVARRAGNNEEAGAIGGLSRQMNAELDKLVPSYQTARRGAAQFFGADDALEAGKNFVGMKLNDAEAQRAIGKMSAPERGLFAESFASELIERIGNAKDRSSVLEQAFITSPNARRRIQIALGPQRAKQLEAYLRIETKLDEFRQAVSGGPSTARQLAQMGLPGVAGGSLAFVSPYSPTEGSVSPSAAVALGIMGMRYGINRKIAQRVGEMLASEDPKVFMKGLKTVSRNETLMKWIRSLDKPLTKAGAQQGTQAAEPLKIYLNAGERDRVVGARN